jgi:NAD(P)-dependent dehydrogenase (short-subunit alcohol dehydrogenase family)
MMTRAAAVKLVSKRIRVNTICPGPIQTGLTETGPEEIVRGEPPRHLMDRPGTPEELANGALYLSEDESAFLTGTELGIDRG